MLVFRRLGIPLLFVLLMSAALGGCDDGEPFPAGKAARNLNPYISFVRSTHLGGVEFFSPDGARISGPSAIEGSAISLTPDLSGYAFVKRMGTDRRSLQVLLAGSPVRELAVQSSGGFEIRWADAHGDVFFVRDRGAVSMYTRCGGDLVKEPMASDVKLFTFSDRRLFYVQRSAPTVLHWKEIRSNVEGSVDSGEPPDLIAIGPSENRILQFTRRAGFFLLDVDTGSITPLEMPVELDIDTGISDFETLKGTSLLIARKSRASIFDLWSFSDVRLWDYWLWNYQTGSITRLVYETPAIGAIPGPAGIWEVPPRGCARPHP